MGKRSEYSGMTSDHFIDRLVNLQRSLAVEGHGDLLETEFFWSAIWAMLNAMLVSYYKYGAMAVGYPERVNALGTPSTVSETAFDGLGSFGKRLRWYFFGERNLYFGEPDEKEYNIEPGNAEYLADAMNFIGIEFSHPAHPLAHYTPTDKAGSPGRVAVNPIYDGKPNQFANRDLADGDEKLGE